MSCSKLKKNFKLTNDYIFYAVNDVNLFLLLLSNLNQTMEYKYMTIDDINKTTVKDRNELKRIIKKRYANNNEIIDVGDLDVSNVKSFKAIFANCRELKVIKGLETWDTSKAEDMSGMFDGCKSLTLLDVSHFDTSNVKKMTCMFCDCDSLTSLDLSNFNTSKVKYMTSMFCNCDSLASLNLSNFNTSKVKDMKWIHGDCESLTSLNLSSINTTNLGYMPFRLNGCNIITIY